MKAFLIALALGAITASTPALAQHQDIEKRSTAMSVCSVDGFGGYGSYDICVEQTYDDMINFRGYRVEAYVFTDTTYNLVPLECFGRIQDKWCDVG